MNRPNQNANADVNTAPPRDKSVKQVLDELEPAVRRCAIGKMSSDGAFLLCVRAALAKNYEVNRFLQSKEAEANAEADKKRREFIEQKNHADALIHQVEKNLKEHESRISAQDKGEAEAAINAARSAMEGTDADALKSATERLSQAAMKIGEAMYKAQQEAGASAGPGPGPDASGGPGAGSGPAGGKADDKVVDAEFEEVDENKKKSA